MNVARSAIAFRRLTIALMLVALVGGCASMRRPLNVFQSPSPAAPVVLQPNATLPAIIAAINANTARVKSYVSYNAQLSIPGVMGVPILPASIALEQPRRFRLRAGVLGSNEIDLGSNYDEFWFWVRRNDPAALYFCRHDQFANSPARDVLLIEPSFVADALGLVYLDPNGAHQGPTVRSDGALEIRSTIDHPSGPRSRVTIVDPTRAWVLEQHLYDSAGQPIASSLASDFQYDPTSQVSLPRSLSIRLPRDGMTLAIDTGTPAINVPPGDPAQLWTRPTLDGYPVVDLAQQAPAVTSAPAPSQVPFPSEPAVPSRPAPAQVAAPTLPTTAPPAVATAQRLPANGIPITVDQYGHDVLR